MTIDRSRRGMSGRPQQIGRLAMRAEGKWWVAYYARPATMMGAVTLGKIALRFVADQDRKDRFMALMREAVSDLIEETTGERPTWPDGPQPAPDHERAGNA